MCEPVSAALSLVGALASVAQQVQTAQAQKKVAEQRAKNEKLRVTHAYESELSKLTARRNAKRMQIFEKSVEGQIARANARTLQELGVRTGAAERHAAARTGREIAALQGRFAGEAADTLNALQRVEEGATANLELQSKGLVDPGLGLTASISEGLKGVPQDLRTLSDKEKWKLS